MLDFISSWSTFLIAAVAALHLMLFGVLQWWARRTTANIAHTLRRFTDGLPHRSSLDWNSHLSDQVEAFLLDIDEVLANSQDQNSRAMLCQRMKILDERRDYLQSLRFETTWNVARNMIEAYPLAGVLGTICAIGAALAADQSGTVSAIVNRFGEAIWSTFAGLVAAIVLMLVNSLLEPSFARLAENRVHIRETVAKAKRELSTSVQSTMIGANA